MDIKDVDKIILQHFQSLGWETEEAEINSLKDLDVSDIGSLMMKCLTIINPQCELPTRLPHNMAQRFRCAANIALVIKNLGYHGDLGYQNILYPNEIDLRKLFMFLIEKTPKDSPTILKGPQDANTLIQTEAKKKLSAILQSPWIPSHCQSIIRKYRIQESKGVPLTQLGTSHCKPFSTGKLTEMSPIGIEVPFQPCDGQFFATCLELHSVELGRELNLSYSKMIGAIDGCSSSRSLSEDFPKLIPKHKSSLNCVIQALDITQEIENTASVSYSRKVLDLEEQLGEGAGEAELKVLLEDLRLKLEETELALETINASIAKVLQNTTFW